MSLGRTSEATASASFETRADNFRGIQDLGETDNFTFSVPRLRKVVHLDSKQTLRSSDKCLVELVLGSDDKVSTFKNVFFSKRVFLTIFVSDNQIDFFR